MRESLSALYGRLREIYTALVPTRMKRSTLAWSSLALAALILLSVNLVGSVRLGNWKLDLTEDRTFTISEGTREILKSIDEPIELRLYFSKRLGSVAPEYARYFDRVYTFFEQYRDLSNGKILLSVVDPEPFSDAEDKAVAAGLRGLRLNAEGELGYFGLVAKNSIDTQETIALFSPDRESVLEYDVTKLVYTLSHPKKRTVGLIAGIPLDGGRSPIANQPQPPWLVMTQIREFFDVRTLDQGVKEIPSDIDVLMVVQPTGLTNEAAYAIDQYALKGGKLLVFVDPTAEAAQLATIMQGGEGRKKLTDLLKAWGVEFDATKAAADIEHARRVQFGGSSQSMVTEYVGWLTLDKRNINPRDVLSAGIEVINVGSSGFFKKRNGASTELSPIIETSREASIVAADKMGMGADPLGLLRNYVAGGEKLILAARLSGEAKSAFPDGPPKAQKDDKSASAPVGDQAPAATGVTSGKINAIIVADTDILADHFWVDRREMLGQELVMPSAHNAAFVVGALENLSGSDALIALRGRGVTERPFTWIEALRRDAERRFREKEQQLEQKLKAAQAEIAKLEQSGESGSVIVSDAERQTIERFRNEVLETRRQLREVKLALRRDIDSLVGWLKFANIALVPIVVVLIGVAFNIARMARRRNKNGTT